MAGGEAEATIITKVVKELLGDAAEGVERDAVREGAESAAKRAAEDGAESAAKRGAEDGAESAAKRTAEDEGEAAAARESSKPLEDGETGKEAESRSGTKDPIDVATGEVLFGEIDVTLRGVLPFAIERMHISSYRQGGLYGISWASTLDQRLEIDSDAIRYAAPDGTIRTYPPVFSQGIELAPTSGPIRPLIWLGSDGYVINDPKTGRRIHFSAPGGASGTRLPLTEISDRNGNSVTFHYDQTATLIEIRHSGGYRIAVDTDGPPGRKRVRALRLVTSEQSDGIRVIGYSYDRAGHLSEVINSSGRPMRFEYDEHARMTSLGGSQRPQISLRV